MISDTYRHNGMRGEDDWAEGLAEQKRGRGGRGSHSDQDMHRGDLQDLDQEEDMEVAPEDNKNLEVVLDIPVTISMEIGRTLITIRNLLQLNQGSVVELDRVAGEPMDVLVNGCLIAHGEVVVVNEKFGIRLTDVISPVERVKKLR
ncbi:flagellar motor switch protein FliN [Gammaproteobacteria bacterium]